MRYNKPYKPLDEREKLRKFRELDDAFASALQKLDKPTSHIRTSKIESASLEESCYQREKEHQRIFEQRLVELMDEYQLASSSVLELLKTLLKFKKIS